MIISEYFKYFEEKYNVKLTILQKRVFIEAVRGNNTVYVTGMRGGKTLLHNLIEEYKEIEKGEKK